MVISEYKFITHVLLGTIHHRAACRFRLHILVVGCHGYICKLLVVAKVIYVNWRTNVRTNVRKRVLTISYINRVMSIDYSRSVSLSLPNWSKHPCLYQANTGHRAQSHQAHCALKIYQEKEEEKSGFVVSTILLQTAPCFKAGLKNQRYSCRGWQAR